MLLPRLDRRIRVVSLASLVATLPFAVVACSDARPASGGATSVAPVDPSLVAGVSGESTPGAGTPSAAPGTPSTATPADGTTSILAARERAWTVAEYEGRFDVASGKLSLEPIGDAANEVAPSVFGEHTRSTTTLRFVNGAATGANVACGDAANGIPDTTNPAFCANVWIENNNNRNYNLVWAEFFEITPGYLIQTGSPDTVPTALAGYVSSAPGAYNYGDISPTSSSMRRWVFRTPGPTAGNFSFKVRIKTAPTRTEYSRTEATGTFVDACASLTGDRELIGFGEDSAIASRSAPFPLTVYNRAATSYTVTPNGVITLGSNTGVLTDNSALPNASTSASNGAVFVFWDDQRTRDFTADPPSANALDGQVCYLVTGTSPGRSLYVTWKNTVLNSAPANDTNLVYTVRFGESEDAIEFQYSIVHDLATASWPNPVTTTNMTITSRSRGDSATFGFQGAPSGTGCATPDTNFCLQANSLGVPFLPTSFRRYPRSFRWAPANAN